MIADGLPITTIQAEIDKCNVLCANCHRRKTLKTAVGLGNNGKN